MGVDFKVFSNTEFCISLFFTYLEDVWFVVVFLGDYLNVRWDKDLMINDIRFLWLFSCGLLNFGSFGFFSF